MYYLDRFHINDYPEDLAAEKAAFFKRVTEAQKACDCEWSFGITFRCLKNECPRHRIMGRACQEL